MSLYRCAACGSKNVVIDTQTSGVSYNYAKGAIGTVVLGVGGAVAGIEGKTQEVYKCPDCGLTLTHPMNSELALMIDLGVMSVEARDNLKLQGYPIPWDYLVKTYKNIESGLADETIKERAEQKAKKQANDEAYAKELADYILVEMKKPVEPIDYEKEQQTWEILNKEKIDAKANAIDEAKLRNKDESLKAGEEKEETLKKEYNNLSKQISHLTEEIESLNNKLNSLGVFKFSEKKEIKSKIESAEKNLNDAKSKIISCDEAHQKEAKIEAIKKEEEKLSAILENIEKSFDIPLAPKEKAKTALAWKKRKEQLKQDSENDYNCNVKYHLMLVAEYVDEELTQEQYQILLEKCFGLEVSSMRVGAYLRQEMPTYFYRSEIGAKHYLPNK